MSFFLQVVVAGICAGILYGISALGFLVIYRSSRTLNLAHGGFMTFGAFLFLVLSLWGNWPFALTFPIALVGSLILGLLTERFLIRRLVGKNMIHVILMTLGIALILRGVIHAVIDARMLSFPDVASRFSALKWSSHQPWSMAIWGPIGFKGQFQGDGTTILIGPHIAILLMGTAFMVLLWFLLNHTPQGISLKSVAENSVTARSVGIRIKRVFSLSWAIAVLTCAISGILLGVVRGIPTNTLSATGLVVFPVVILGGISGFSGAALGGLLIGLVQYLTTAYIGAAPGEISPYGVLLIMMVLKPFGLTGFTGLERV